MPVEIRELVIKTIVEEGKPDGDSAGPASSNDQDVIIQICVEKVLEILKDKTER
jgi:hypothetical protein